MEIISTQAAPDRTANKAGMAAFFEVSVPTVDAWIRRGCPHVARGGRGKIWQFDVLEVAKWYYGGQDKTNVEDTEKLAPKDRLDWYRGARERTKHNQETGELVSIGQYVAELSAALKLIANNLESLPDLLERDVGLDANGVIKVQAVIDRLRQEMHVRLTEMTAESDGAS